MTLDIATLPDAADALLPEVVALRRAIHAEPELGLHNPLTAAKVRATLAGLPLEWREGPSTSGLIAILRGTGGTVQRTVLLRGDTDALPMAEETGLDYASTVAGQMHACGHDAHTAMLAGAAKLLCAQRARFAGTVLFMFQPGEEGFHGARFMIEDGLLDDPAPDAAFALHVMPNAPHGVFSGRAGPLTAAADMFDIVVTGRGGHGAMPHDAVDPIPIACEIVLAIQAMVTRRISVFDPAVVTVGMIAGGTTDNVIPGKTAIKGTIRTLSEDTRAAVKRHLATLIESIATAHGATTELALTEGFPVTRCDPVAVAHGHAVARGLFGEDAFVAMPDPLMGAEDFSYVLQRVPGAMFFLGASPEGSDWRGCRPIHSSRMVLDERVFARGVAMHAGFALDYLANGFAA